MGVLQLEIFPSVTEEDRQAVKNLLSEYTRIKSGVSRLNSRVDSGESITAEEQETLINHGKLIKDIDDAIALIIDAEVRQIITDRYFQSRRHKYTVLKFRGSMGERTIDRRIEKGIETIAESLKMWGNKYLTVKWR